MKSILIGKMARNLLRFRRVSNDGHPQNSTGNEAITTDLITRVSDVMAYFLYT